MSDRLTGPIVKRGPTQNERILALLKTGPKSTHEILRVVPCIVHSRIAELRTRGHVIPCDKTGPDYVYTLEGSLDEPGSSPHREPPAAPRGTGEPCSSSDADQPGPELGAAQLSLLEAA